MPIIKARGIAHVRLSAPDLDAMEAFLTEFGMVRSARTETALYMRGMGPSQYIHVTELGPAGFIGLGYQARSEEDLHTLSAATGAAVEDIDGPGGGKRVRLIDLNGFQIDTVFGIAELEPLPDPVSLLRLPGMPSSRKGRPRVTRIAHGVLTTPKLHETLAWFREHFGFIPTDELFVNGDESNMIGSFNRVDADEDHVDHHVFFCLRNQKAGMHHCSFEVADVNDVFIGHDHLGQKGYEHIRGISRHALGSQIFDYWVSPFDQMHELWSSNERFNVHSGSNMVPIGAGLNHDGGDKPSERFVKQSTPVVQRA